MHVIGYNELIANNHIAYTNANYNTEMSFKEFKNIINKNVVSFILILTNYYLY